MVLNAGPVAASRASHIAGPADTTQRSFPLNGNASRAGKPTRHERRAAARGREQVSGPRRPRPEPAATSRPAWKSPIALITGGVLVVAVVGLIALQLLPGSGHSKAAAPGTRTTVGILVPALGTDITSAQGRSLGRADAPLKLIVWSDYQCPACKNYSETIEPRLVTNYVNTGKLLIEYRDMVIIGPESQAAAAASRCADQQGQFWPYHDVLFANQAAENSGALTPNRLKDMADALGLDRTKFDACLPSTDLLSQIEVQTTEGRTRGKSTPTLDFGSRVIAGSPAYPELAKIVDELLAAAGTPAASGAPASAGASATP